MSNLNQIIDYTKLFQDVELATAIGQLKQNPTQLQQFLQTQQNKVYTDVVKQKDSTFQKVYGDLNRASQAQDAILLYNKRNKELANIQQTVYNNQKNSADAMVEDKNLANRKYEMNQWSVNNKNDTLFVFSMLFIMISGLILIIVLWRMGLISSKLCAALAAPLIIIFILTVINRSQYTNIFRDKRYWNKRSFDGNYGKIPVPLCPGSLSGIKNDLNSFSVGIASDISSAEQDISSVTQSAEQDISSTAQSAEQGLSTVYNKL